MWRYIKGVRDASASLYNSCIRLDGANDYLTLGNSPFYNVGTGEFTFVFSILPLIYSNAQNVSPKAIWRKGLSTNIARIVCNFSNVNSGMSLVLVDPAGNQDSLSIPFSDIPLYRWSTVTITRRGTNFAPSTDAAAYVNSIRNPKNYNIYVNGVNKLFSTSMSNSAGLIYEVDNSEEFIIGNRDNNIDAYFSGFIDFFSIYNRALSADEIAIAATGVFPDDGAKGIFDFNQNTKDSSSVGNDMTLLNNSESIYRTFPRKDGLIMFFSTDVQNTIKTFTYPEDIFIASIVKITQSNISVSRDQVTWTNFTSALTEINPLNMNLPANTPLYIRMNNTQSNVIRIISFDF
jgi:hypothetical protein